MALTTFAEAVAQIRQHVETHLNETRALEPFRIHRLEIAVDPTDPLIWLQAQTLGPAFYWSDREADCEVAAIGAADRVHTREELEPSRVMTLVQERLHAQEASITYAGGMRFPTEGRDPAWRPFGTAYFFLPRFELRREGTDYRLAMHLTSRDYLYRARILELLDQLVWEHHERQWMDVLPVAREDRPDRLLWNRVIAETLEAFATTPMEKVVLARRVRFIFERRLDAFLLLQRLKGETPHCFHFLFSPRPEVAFLGASPERLYRREGRLLLTEAVAGTRRRGTTPEEDHRLGRALLESAKDRHEHELVVRHIRQGLAPLCTSLDQDAEARLMQLARKQHLLTRFRGILREEVGDPEIVEAIYPTPAVGGKPSHRALTWIARMEPFDRGWYTGLIGHMGRETTEFAVGIRCGLVHHSVLDLFSGAGIVPGSTPEAEWEEIEHKISDFLDILTAKATR